MSPDVVHAEVDAFVAGGEAERLPARELLSYVTQRFHPRLTLACSFQKEDSVLLDLLLEVQPKARVFALDTHVLFPETYALWRAIEKRYGIQVEVYEGPSLGRQAAVHGDALWETKPNLCCAIRKVEPLARALSDASCWITGIRRDQSPTRADALKLGWDDRHELWKASPLADWSDDDVWAYVRDHDLPVNELHQRGYASIGCTHCTRPGEGREGRWSGIDKTECGLHTLPVSAE
ncbi:MAG: phosphoadenylyl-sulfate reductase [Actinobacteria bacterium]|nr:MAG: phosphoadenylyl-sulfate reductase [Actinomycetota bacterium]